MHKSIVRPLGAVPFPEWTGEKVYMRPFTKAAGLPAHLKRWQPTVDAMLAEVRTDAPIYLMIDQGRVEAGSAHRRPGIHIDGYWIPALDAHGGGHRGNKHSLAAAEMWQDKGKWGNIDLTEPEAVILASDVEGCRAYIGDWDGEIREGGDCSTVPLRGLQAVPFEAGRAYAGNVAMLHESIPMQAACQRTVVRLNVPGWSP